MREDKVISDRVKVKIFNDVDQLRARLTTVGIGEMGEWRDDEMGGFVSITEYHRFGRNNLNNLAYYLESDNHSYASTLKLVLNINSKNETREALTKLAEVGDQTFKVLEIEIPGELKSSILKGRPINLKGDDFETELRLERSKIDTWIVQVKTKP